LVDAIEKSKRRKAKSIARKKGKDRVPRGVPHGMGMGWLEEKDRAEPEDDNPNHDGKRWLLPG